VTVLLTEWEEFQAAQPEALGALVSRRRVLDARHALDGDRYLEAGWEYRTLGRPVTAAASPRGRSAPGPGEQEQLLPTAPAPSAQAAPLRLGAEAAPLAGGGPARGCSGGAAAFRGGARRPASSSAPPSRLRRARRPGAAPSRPGQGTDTCGPLRPLPPS